MSEKNSDLNKRINKRINKDIKIITKIIKKNIYKSVDIIKHEVFNFLTKEIDLYIQIEFNEVQNIIEKHKSQVNKNKILQQFVFDYVETRKSLYTNEQYQEIIRLYNLINESNINKDIEVIESNIIEKKENYKNSITNVFNDVIEKIIDTESNIYLKKQEIINEQLKDFKAICLFLIITLAISIPLIRFILIEDFSVNSIINLIMIYVYLFWLIIGFKRTVSTVFIILWLFLRIFFIPINLCIRLFNKEKIIQFKGIFNVFKKFNNDDEVFTKFDFLQLVVLAIVTVSFIFGFSNIEWIKIIARLLFFVTLMISIPFVLLSFYSYYKNKLDEEYKKIIKAAIIFSLQFLTLISVIITITS